jgi:hypothetical protein
MAEKEEPGAGEQDDISFLRTVRLAIIDFIVYIAVTDASTSN